MQFDIADFLTWALAIVSAITIHEAAHAFAADRLGDDTPRRQGRVTLWPLAHLDPLGSLFMLVTYFSGFGVGWGRPVQFDPTNFRQSVNRRLGSALVAFAGPLSNMILAGVLSLVLRANLFPADDANTMILLKLIQINVLLFFFNLLPLFPLDGSHLLANAMPPPLAERYYELMRQWGFFIFIALVLTGALTPLIVQPASAVFSFLTGEWTLRGR